jgi:hypothetical protein
MIHPPDVPYSDPIPVVVMGVTVPNVVPCDSGGMSTLVCRTYIGDDCAWYRIELPSHKRLVRDAQKSAREYTKRMLLAQNAAGDKDRFLAAYQFAHEALTVFTLAGKAVGEDTNPKLDGQPTLSGGINRTTIVVDAASLDPAP